MSIKKLLSACTAAVSGAVFATAVVMTTSFTPVLADGPAFCPGGDDDDSVSEASNRNCTGEMDTIPVCGLLGNAFETHRDCVENMTADDWATDPSGGDGFGGCGDCHSLDPPLPMEFPPSCQTCHGVKWDFGDDDESEEKDGDAGHEPHPFPFDNGWTDPEEQHPDYVEEFGVSDCALCHDYELASPEHEHGVAPGCATCHDAVEICDTPGAGTDSVPGTEFCLEDDDHKSD